MRFSYGGGAGEYVADSSGRPAPSKTVTFWDAESGGAQYTDLLVGGNPATQVTSGVLGKIPALQGPDGVMTMWADGGGSTRVRLDAWDDELPNDAAVEALLNDPASATAAKLKATYVAALLPEKFGAIGDGVTDDTAAMQAWAEALCTSGGLGVATQAYKTTGTVQFTKAGGIGSNLPVTVDLTGSIIYTGSGSAVKIGNKKKFQWRGKGEVDISGAGASAVGIHVAGLWFGEFLGPTVVQGPASSGGILIETSLAGGDNFGSYAIKVIEPNLQVGAGAFGIKTMQTSGDTVSVTHLSVDNGWINAKTTGFHGDHIHGAWLFGTAFETLPGDAIYLTEAGGVVISHGEISVAGWTLNLGPACSNIAILPSYVGGVGSMAGYINIAQGYTPVQIGAGTNQAFNVGAGQLTAGVGYLESVVNKATANNAALNLLTTGVRAHTAIAGNVPLSVENSGGSPTANLQNWTAGSLKASLDVGGTFRGAGLNNIASFSNAAIATAATGTSVKTGVAANAALTVQNTHTTPTGDLLALKNTGGTTKTAVLPAGTLLSDDAAQGVILKDSGGTYWRVTVGTDGVLTTASLGTSRPVA